MNLADGTESGMEFERYPTLKSFEKWILGRLFFYFERGAFYYNSKTGYSFGKRKNNKKEIEVILAGHVLEVLICWVNHGRIGDFSLLEEIDVRLRVLKCGDIEVDIFIGGQLFDKYLMESWLPITAYSQVLYNYKSQSPSTFYKFRWNSYGDFIEYVRFVGCKSSGVYILCA